MSAYPAEFNRELRERIKRRDAFMCTVCGLTEEESKVRFNQSLSVHHKDEDKSNNDERNLVTVCKSCHQRTHWNREFIL